MKSSRWLNDLGYGFWEGAESTEIVGKPYDLGIDLIFLLIYLRVRERERVFRLFRQFELENNH